MEINPAYSNIFMCFETAGRLISKFSASELMVRLSFESSFSICLLLGSAIAWKVSSVCGAIFCNVYFIGHFLHILMPALAHAGVDLEVFRFVKTTMLQDKF